MLHPDENKYIDLHTHTAWNFPNIYCIRNMMKPDEYKLSDVPGRPVSMGLHPWFLDLLDNSSSILLLQEAAVNPNVMAIGECGIDMKKGPHFEIQEKVFIQQAELAESMKKPLVIHCVKAYQQLFLLIRSFKPTVPWIFHGFNHNDQVAGQLLEHGAYLSIGKDVLKENSKIRAAITRLPLDRIFFETDEWQQPVWKIYKEVGTLLSIPDTQLKKLIHSNFLSCFPVEK